MKFADFVSPAAIRADLQAGDKEGVIKEMVTALVEAGDIATENKDAILSKIIEREQLGSTGIGRGVAVPHTKHASVTKLVGTVGVSTEGVDFDVVAREGRMKWSPDNDKKSLQVRALYFCIKTAA